MTRKPADGGIQTGHEEVTPPVLPVGCPDRMGGTVVAMLRFPQVIARPETHP